MHIEVTLTHPAAAFAAMIALEEMSDQPPHADGVRVRLPVAERSGAVMEAARRLFRAGVGADDIVVIRGRASTPSFRCASAARRS